MKIAIYNENCLLAGKFAANNEEIDDYREQNGGQDCGDWTVYEADSRGGLLDLARNMLEKAGIGARGSYDCKTALSIIDMIGDREEILTDNDIYRLGQLTTRNEDGVHFTVYEEMNWVWLMHTLGFCVINIPEHKPSGIIYDQQYWSVHISDNSRNVIDVHPELFA